jgi:uncharacterized protein YycO
MFNDAGISGALTPVPLSSLDLTDFERVVVVNTHAVLAGVKHAAASWCLGAVGASFIRPAPRT